MLSEAGTPTGSRLQTLIRMYAAPQEQAHLIILIIILILVLVLVLILVLLLFFRRLSCVSPTPLWPNSLVVLSLIVVWGPVNLSCPKCIHAGRTAPARLVGLKAVKAALDSYSSDSSLQPVQDAGVTALVPRAWPNSQPGESGGGSPECNPAVQHSSSLPAVEQPSPRHSNCHSAVPCSHPAQHYQEKRAPVNQMYAFGMRSDRNVSLHTGSSLLSMAARN